MDRYETTFDTIRNVIQDSQQCKSSFLFIGIKTSIAKFYCINWTSTLLLVPLNKKIGATSPLDKAKKDDYSMI